MLLCAFVCIKMGRVEYQNVQTQTQDVHCGLSGPLCAQNIPLYAIKAIIHFYCGNICYILKQMIFRISYLCIFLLHFLLGNCYIC